MPRNNKTGKLYYTKEQYQKAKYECSALSYALQKGYPLIRNGRYYHMEGHDSMIFAPDGMWYWNSRGLTGKALDFIVNYENLSVLEAVLELTEGTGAQPVFRPLNEPIPPPAAPFVLPERSPNNRRLYAYLCKERKLENSVVTDLVNQGLLYEGVKRHGEQESHNAVFVYRNAEGTAVGAYLRGLNSNIPYKRDVSGSDKSYGWLMRGNTEQPDTLYVFEAAIDAASHLSLARLRGDAAAEKADRLSLEGLGPRPLKNYLGTHPDIQRVVICVDNDPAGRAGAGRLRELISGKEVEIQFPPAGKDWNDTLRIRK